MTSDAFELSARCRKKAEDILPGEWTCVIESDGLDHGKIIPAMGHCFTTLRKLRRPQHNTQNENPNHATYTSSLLTEDTTEVESTCVMGKVWVEELELRMMMLVWLWLIPMNG
jgi:hypothetical protein